MKKFSMFNAVVLVVTVLVLVLLMGAREGYTSTTGWSATLNDWAWKDELGTSDSVADCANKAENGGYQAFTWRGPNHPGRWQGSWNWRKARWNYTSKKNTCVGFTYNNNPADNGRMMDTASNSNHVSGCVNSEDKRYFPNCAYGNNSGDWVPGGTHGYITGP